MSRSDEPGLILGFPSDIAQAERLAAATGIASAAAGVHHFPDGESRVRLPTELPGHVAFYCTLADANRRLIELELAAAAALELGADTLTLIAPYLCYMRQDVAFHPGEAVSQRIVGAFLARRFDTVITVDPHLHRTHDLRDAVPARRAIALTAAPVMVEWLARRSDAPVLIGPDAESEQWVRGIAEVAGLEFAVARKNRLGDKRVEVELPGVTVAGRNIVLVDDVASSGQTLVEATRVLHAAGAASVDVLVTHALFAGDALERLRAVGVENVCSTDSIGHETNQLHLDRLIASALSGRSVPNQSTGR